jgi:hypothetical protein
MAENQTLRDLVKGLSGFIGDGGGGTLAQLGWTQDDFTKFVNRNPSDSAYESFQRHKADTTGAANGSGKRRSGDDGAAAPSTRARGASDTTASAGFVPPPPPPLSAAAGSTESLFSTLVRGAGSNMYVPPVGAGPSGAGMYGALPPLPTSSMHGAPAPGRMSLGMGMTSPPLHTQQPTPYEEDADVDPKHDEAGKLIGSVCWLPARILAHAGDDPDTTWTTTRGIPTITCPRVCGQRISNCKSTP